ncbi:MAG: nucleotidyltransferase domain-containing protein [Candidatus Omnitrophica bacterium]|nr:nucleotidyltransferase domain-containing protein [Candidatus Omnitrophota bacterium]
MISLRSKVTKEILNFFFINPHESLYVNELCGKLNLDKRNLVKKLKELETKGILLSETKGNLKFYSINRNFALYKEYKNIVLKSFGVEDKLKNIINEIPGATSAYIYGSFAKDTMDSYSDIDLLVIGRHSILNLQKSLNKLQGSIDREINVVNMGDEEFAKRLKNKDAFLEDVLKGKHIKLL